MKNLIEVKLNENQEPIVSGRMLHKFLEVKTDYKDWFPRMVSYGFELNKDFSSIMSESTGGRPSTDHFVKLDMAKELCMIQRTERGKQARQYFIAIEKEYNSPQKLIARALVFAHNQLVELKPYAKFGKQISESTGTIMLGEYCKILKNAGIAIGQNKLFEWLRYNNYLISKGARRNQPKQKYIEQGLFAVKERVFEVNYENKISLTTLITGKGQRYFLDKLKETS